MDKRKLYLKSFSILILFVMVLSFIIPFGFNVSADDGDEHIVYDSSGNEILKLTMKKGIVTIETVNTAASTGIRWRTTGMTITRTPITKSKTVKGITGHGDVTDIIDKGSAVLRYNNAKVVDDREVGDKIYSTITFSEEQVAEALKDDFSDITKDTTIYLHAIVETYNWHEDPLKQTKRKTNIQNWGDALNAEAWGTNTLNDFYKYFNMPILYSPDTQPIKLVYETKGKDIIKEDKLDEVLPNTYTEWKNIEEKLLHKNKNHQLIGYYITYNKGANGPSAYIKDGVDISKIRSGKAKVPLGGITIHFVYDSVLHPVDLIYETESGTKLDNKKLDDTELNQYASWTNEKTEITDQGKRYELIGYYISSRDGKKELESKYLSEGATLNSIKSGKFKVPEGGIYIHLVYKEGFPNTLYYHTSRGEEIGSKPLAAALTGETVKWSKEPTSQNYSGTDYGLVGYYVTKKSKPTVKVVEKSLSTGTKLSALASASTTVSEGGMNIYLIYDRKYTNELRHYTDTGAWVSYFPLEDKVIGDYVSWADEPQYIEYDGEHYELTRYNVSTKTDRNTILESKSIESGVKLKNIQNGKTKVYEGGMYVNLFYRLIDGPPITPPPTITPTPTIAPTPTPTPIVVPEPEVVTEHLILPKAYGHIRADVRGNERFIVDAGVATTESLYTEVRSEAYLMGYRLEKKVGVETYPVKVKKKYILEWEGENATGDVTQKEEVEVEQVVSITRAYGYWEIINFDYYRIDRADLFNYALPGGTSVLRPNPLAGYRVPNINVKHSAKMEDHIILPDEFVHGIELPAETIVATDEKPAITEEDFTDQANSVLPELFIKNDLLTIDGTAIMSDALMEKEGPDINEAYLLQTKDKGMETINDTIMYQPNQVIEASKKNGTYYSNGTITYQGVTRINSNYYYTIQEKIDNLENVVIHTPVVCHAIVTSDNNKHLQLIEPSDSVQLVLDPDATLNDFTLSISNYGYHSNRQGYLTRDFSKSIIDPMHTSYINQTNHLLQNEAKFPFDVFMKQGSGDRFIKKNTWLVIDRNTIGFYLPMWVQEGIYTVHCRTVAVNADRSILDQISEQHRNTKPYNYVATDTFSVEISGRIYGLSLYDIADYPMWEEAFRVGSSLELKLNNLSKYVDGTQRVNYSKGYSYYYTVGTNDQYGNDTSRNVKYTVPLVNGSHPYYRNVGALKKGYVVRFTLDTIGSMYSSNSSIRIRPSFYHVDKNGKNRTPVEIYYEEEINGKSRSLVKVGSKLDKTNMKMMEVGSPYVGIPNAEMTNTASILNMRYSIYLSQQEKIFTFSQIDILSTFRTYVNSSYLTRMKNRSDYAAIRNAGITEDMIMKQLQSWYGCYYIPSKSHMVIPSDVPGGMTVHEYAAKKGIDYSESFWKKDGYLIVNFDIVTIDKDGKERLSYINAANYLNSGHSSMWTKEGAPLRKTDNNGITFSLKAGDFALYDITKSVQEDYKEGGIY